MTGKILMNKNTLAALKLELKEYESALPVFEMKEQQLKEVVQAVEVSISRLKKAIMETIKETKEWVAVMADQDVNLLSMVQVKRVATESREIAGVGIKEFVSIEFEDQEIDPFDTPLWVDKAMSILVDQKTRQVMLDIERHKLESLTAELYEARRMKNALKEVFIPDTLVNIRKIEIYLGDIERLAIGCAKLVKKKKLNKVDVT